MFTDVSDDNRAGFSFINHLGNNVMLVPMDPATVKDMSNTDISVMIEFLIQKSDKNLDAVITDANLDAVATNENPLLFLLSCVRCR